MRKLRQLWLVDTVFVSLFELIEASHRVHTANEVNCHAVLHARRVFHFILLKTIHSQQSKAVTIHTKLHSMATKQQQLPIGHRLRKNNVYKKLSYRRGTARCVVSVEILPIATQQCRNYLYDKS